MDDGQTITLVKGVDYQDTWSVSDDEGVGQFAASDTLAIVFFPVAGDSAALTVSPGGGGTSTGIINIDATTGEFDVLIKAAQITTLATALSLPARGEGRARFAVTATTTDSVKRLVGFGTAIVRPEI